jgi:hypothetical protein
MTKYYVVAGNHIEYFDFTQRKHIETGIPLSNFVYVDSEVTIVGVENPTGWLYGTWRQRWGIESIIERLIICKRDGNVRPIKKILENMRNGS